MTHEFGLRVYYEDTDLAGIVYYANYLKFIERARTEMIRTLGVNQAAVKADSGIVFAVRRVEAEYLSPARFDDKLTVATTLREVTGARFVLNQDVRRGSDVLFTSTVTLVCLTESGRPVRIPADIRRKVTPAAG
jgi:acyl-CoA thioester hydrolase